METKYIFVTGGVVSGLGKGITAASLGRLLKARGYKVTVQKFDPYINFDPGTMSPYQHGEVFVTDDGAETDLDLGHYERFIDESLNQGSNITTGKIYWSVISKERKGDYLGNTVQVIPHITNEIKDRIFNVAKETNTDIVITEIGGTVGDIESLPFLEAIRQVKHAVGAENCMYIHVTLMPYISGSNEIKTKPTQHSVKELLSLGIQPDVIVCRTEISLTPETRAKVALFCNVGVDAVIQNLTVPTLYEAPLMLEREGFATVVCKRLALTKNTPNLCEWEKLIKKIYDIKETGKYIKIGLVGKYVEMRDAYLSVAEALRHAGYENDVNIDIDWIQAEDLNAENIKEKLKGCCGILVPGGFGERGIEGKIEAIHYARINKVPFFGICLGMQMAVVEYARNILGFKDANSSEFHEESEHCVIDLMLEQKKISNLGGTMRLGLYPCKLNCKGFAVSAYGGEKLIYERHRHRYEFNNEYRTNFKDHGMRLTGLSPDERLVEIIELPDHPWFVGVQFHPEFRSRPNRAHPLFRDFIKASKTFSENI
ncbi:MAG: synthase [Clostridia bacterium]|nr:synthase [Clostridia bacterium]